MTKQMWPRPKMRPRTLLTQMLGSGLFLAGVVYASATAHWSRVELAVVWLTCLTATVILSISTRMRRAEFARHVEDTLKGDSVLLRRQCAHCGFDLTGLDDGGVCPECGEALRLRVSLSEPKMAAYLFGLIGLSMGVGFSGIVLVFVVVSALLYGYERGFFDWIIVALVSQFVIEGLAMWLWLVRRNWIRRRSRGQRRALAVAAWGCSIGFSVLWFTLEIYL